jgi:nucleoid-associated protein YgaU
MTRETKIGLLVGLAFIIVIGILLSDHMTATTEPISAPLTNTAGNVRASVAAPVTDPPPITTAINQPVTPREMVPTRSNETDRTSGQEVVSIGGPGDTGGATQSPLVIRQQSGVINNPNNDNPAPTPAPTPPSLQDVAQQNGEAVVNTDGSDTATATVDTKPRKYTAVSGDTLSKMASRFLGGNTKANRDAIVRANPSLRADPNRVIVGHVYVIPATPAAAPAAPPAGVANNTPSTPAEPSAASTTGSTDPSVTASQPQYWYTVKENDSLWSIAADQLGNGSAWTAIKDLNSDLLKGSDVVHPNMRLRLPAKPLASAAQ